MIYDLLVIGGGSGGVRAARIAASLGAAVAICEDTHWGGTCVNVGCVPKKLYHYAASIKNTAELGKAYGWQMELNDLDWQHFFTRKEAEIKRLKGIYHKLLNNAGCDVYEGFGKIQTKTDTGMHQVLITDNVGNQTLLTSKKVLLAVGGTPVMPNVVGIEHAMNSDDLFALPDLPKKLLVVGGGYIACEMASIYHKLGVDVSLAVRSQLLKAFDRETVDFLEDELVKDGLTMLKGMTPSQLTLENADNGKVTVQFNNAGKNKTQNTHQDTYDAVLYATGRQPRLTGLGLENTHVQQDEHGFIVVDVDFETDEANIYAVGDIIAGMELTPVALEQGMYLAKKLYAPKQPIRPAFDKVATAIFTHPQMATVGMTEAQATDYAQQTGHHVAVFTSRFRHIKYTVTDLTKQTFIKLLVSATDQILGIHMVGDEVGEIMQGFSVLLHTGITKTQLDQTIGIHPTVAEELVTMREPTRIIS